MYLKGHMNQVNARNTVALDIAQQVMQKSRAYQLPAWSFKALLLSASLYEQSADLMDSCILMLNQAYNLYQLHRLDYLSSVYCVRKSSYYRWKDQADSAIVYVSKGLEYEKNTKQKRENRCSPAVGHTLPAKRFR